MSIRVEDSESEINPDKPRTFKQRAYDYWIGDKEASCSAFLGDPIPCNRLTGYGCLLTEIAFVGGMIYLIARYHH